jgi:hypothetical protein
MHPQVRHIGRSPWLAFAGAVIDAAAKAVAIMVGRPLQTHQPAGADASRLHVVGAGILTPMSVHPANRTT